MSDELKRQAGRAAADLVADGMVVGLGTGSTANHAIARLGERVAAGLRITGIPTSRASEALATACGIEVIGFDRASRVDLTIDGADEVDPGGSLIKGGGGALLREKVVAHRSREVVIVVDPAKLVERLGVRFALPVEVVPFAWPAVADEIAGLGGAAACRVQAGVPFITDNHNMILDVRFADGIPDPAALEQRLGRIPGVVESGLFIGLATRLVIGRAAGPETRTLRPGRAGSTGP